MVSEERVIKMIRASVEADTRGLVLPDDLLERVTRPKPRRHRIHFSVAVAALATAAAAVTVPILVADLSDRETSTDGPTVAITPFDPRAQIAIKYVPDGFKQDGREPSIALTPLPGPVKGEDNRVVYQTELLKSKKPYSPRCSMKVWTGNVGLDTFMLRNVKMHNLQLPLGKALISDFHDDRLLVVLWEPEPGVLIFVTGARMSKAEMIKIVKGITYRA